jgi:hypothetical protein
MKTNSIYLLFIILLFSISGKAQTDDPIIVTQGYSLTIQQVFPEKGKVITLATNKRSLDEIDPIIRSEKAKRKGNFVFTVKGPGNYLRTESLQNIFYLKP